MMNIEKTKGVYTPSFFGNKVLTAFSGREFSRSQQEDFITALNIPKDKLILVTQVHGAKILHVTHTSLRATDSLSFPHDFRRESKAKMDPRLTPCGDDNKHQLVSTRPPRNDEGDGLITQERGVALGVFTADCLPVFFYDPENGVIGIVHAGWRGLQQGILKNTVSCFRNLYKSEPKNLLTAIGPSIRKCCYEVGEEFAGYFPKSYTPPNASHQKGHMDLVLEARTQLSALGLQENHFQDSGICTSCQNHQFFSARRGDKAERILPLIQIQTML